MIQNYSVPIQIYEWNKDNGIVLENHRRKILDLMFAKNYNYVHPSFVDYEENLALESGLNHKNQAFCFTDSLNGNQLAIRTDISPQISRMDYALNSNKNNIEKYCYAGQVALKEVDAFSIRNPYQIGAEIFGDSSLESDIEILTLAIECCNNNNTLLVDLGHSGILKKILEKANLNVVQKQQYFAILKHKSIPDFQIFLKQHKITKEQQDILEFLMSANSVEKSLITLKTRLLNQYPDLQNKWDCLEYIYKQVKTFFEQHTNIIITWHFDIAELKRYDYHYGLVFAIYDKDRLLARGGRYNHSNKSKNQKAFRTATGFTLDLNYLT